jgi:hypothetical protein
MFIHCFHRLTFSGAESNAFSIGEHEPLMKANFPDDVLGHFERPDSEQTQTYANSLAGLLTTISGDA